jgi:LAO/AO transport system kinase
MSSKDILQRFLAGDVLAASRVLSLVERGGDEAERMLDTLFSRTGRAYRVAVTGAAGAGKSTLANALTRRFRSRGSTVGIVAEDPSSPFSGGAVLGDRVRMSHAAGDPGVFVRSIASRGSESGLSPLACELADVLDAFGRDVILLESMGVGQVETQIRFTADTVVAVLTPEGGDEVQSLKAGLLEVADILVVNKSDRPGADEFAADLTAMVGLRDAGAGAWMVPVVSTTLRREESMDALADTIARHRAHIDGNGRRDARRREALRARIRLLVEEEARASVRQSATLRERFDGIFERVATGSISPYRAARELGELLKAEVRAPR